MPAIPGDKQAAYRAANSVWADHQLENGQSARSGGSRVDYVPRTGLGQPHPACGNAPRSCKPETRGRKV